MVGVVAGSLLPTADLRHWLGRLLPGVHGPHDTFDNVWSRDPDPAGVHGVQVARTLDGDTFEAHVQVWPGVEVFTRVRLRGIDAPELKAACARERRLAESATRALRAVLDQGQVRIFNIGPDKYAGRVVADAATRATPNVSSALLASGHVRAYEGSRREGWCG